MDKKNILIITLQGLGNSIINLNLIKDILTNDNYHLSIVISNNGSEQIYREIFNNYKLDFITWFEGKSTLNNSLRIFFKNIMKKFEYAYALFPSGKRENVILKFTRADKKFMFKSRQADIKLLQILNSGMPILENENQHDFITNKKLLSQVLTDDFSKIEEKNSVLRNIGFHLGGGSRHKLWPSQNFIELIEILSNEYNAIINVFAGPSEIQLSNKIIDSLGVKVNKIFNKPFATLINKISGLDYFIGNDSSLAHLSSFLGIPTVVLWSFAEHNRVYPYGKNNMVIRKDFSCMPCYKVNTTYNEVISKCDYNFRCINEIDTNDVVEIIKSRDNLDVVRNIKIIEQKPDGCKIISIY